MAGLTVKQVEKARPGAIRREIADSYCPGLYHIVQPTGARSWAVRYRSEGKSRKLTLSVAPLDLAGARRAAATALRAIADGKDPALEKRRARALPPDRDDVRTVVAEFLQTHVDKKTRPSSRRETRRILEKEVLPKWQHRRIQEITRRDVINLVDGVAGRGVPVMANRTFAAVRKLFGWCVEKDKLATSPCTGIKAPSEETQRDRVLTDGELKSIWKACEVQPWPFGRVVQLLILTGQRRDEVAEMHWSEVDFEKRVWTIPRERVKNNSAHEVPLSDSAVAILKSLPHVKSKRELVFTVTGSTPVSGFSRFKERLEAALPDSPPWTLHDIRRTVATGMARLGISLPVIERLLNHRSGTIRRYRWSLSAVRLHTRKGSGGAGLGGPLTVHQQRRGWRQSDFFSRVIWVESQ